jgi:hypothetical protein
VPSAAALAALRGEPLPILSEPEWSEALAYAAAHHILPSVLEALSQRTAEMPEAVRAKVVRELRQQRLDSFWWTSQLTSLLRAFTAATIPVIPLKGPALAERLYGTPHLRLCRDLDLLIRPEHRAQAEAALTQQGFAPVEAADDYHQTWLRGQTPVELHRGIAIPHTFRFDLAGAWARAGQGTVAGQPTLQFAPADELLYLCLHAARHRFERLSLVLDIDHALTRLGDALTPELLTPELLTQAARADLTGPLLVGAALARRLRDTAPDPRITPRADQIAARLWADLTSGHPTPFHTADLYRFFVELEPTPWVRTRRRVRHLRIAATRLIGEDFVFAARFGITSSALVRILRPLRLVLRYALPRRSKAPDP